MKKMFLIILVVLALVSCEEQDPGDFLDKSIEFVIPSNPNGGSDKNAKMISGIAVENEFTPVHFHLDYKPGKSGEFAYSYVHENEGNDHMLMVLHSGQVMAAMVNESPIKADMLTYVSVVAFDELLICVNADSEYKTIEDILNRVDSQSKTLRIGGSQIGGGDHISFMMFQKYIEGKQEYISHNGSSDVLASLNNSYVDIGIFNPQEVIDDVKEGKIIPLAILSEERIGGEFKDVPTFIELGYEEFYFRDVRAISAPPGISKKSLKFYEEMIKKITDTEKWKNEYIIENHMTHVYMNSKETEEFFEQQIETYRILLKEAGLLD